MVVRLLLLLLLLLGGGHTVHGIGCHRTALDVVRPILDACKTVGMRLELGKPVAAHETDKIGIKIGAAMDGKKKEFGLG